MPGGDKTGPVGSGPMTGRAAGYCAGNSAPGYANLGYGRGFYRGGRGYGRGRGRCFGRRGYGYPQVIIAPAINPQNNIPITQPQLPEQEVATLENYQKNLAAEKADLEQEMEGVKARLAELNAKKENK